MARMHSRARGVSSSTKPTNKSNPSWIRYKPKEVEAIILKLGKEGSSTSKIGMVMRDTYGIPDVKSLCGTSISGILDKKKLLPEVPEDLRNLIRKAALVRIHLDENRQDMPAKRGLQLTESKIGRLVKYYKNTGKLPVNWKYDPSKASSYLE